MKKKVKAIVKTMLDDISSNDPKVNTEIAILLNDNRVAHLLVEAGCKPSIIEAMRETVLLSSFERRYCCREINNAIKKIPTDR